MIFLPKKPITPVYLWENHQKKLNSRFYNVNIVQNAPAKTTLEGSGIYLSYYENQNIFRYCIMLDNYILFKIYIPTLLTLGLAMWFALTNEMWADVKYVFQCFLYCDFYHAVPLWNLWEGLFFIQSKS